MRTDFKASLIYLSLLILLLLCGGLGESVFILNKSTSTFRFIFETKTIVVVTLQILLPIVLFQLIKKNLSKKISAEEVVSIQKIPIINFITFALIPILGLISDLTLDDSLWFRIETKDLYIFNLISTSVIFAICLKRVVRKKSPIGILYLNENNDIIKKRMFNSVTIPFNELIEIKRDKKHLTFRFKEGLNNFKLEISQIPEGQMDVISKAFEGKINVSK